VLALAERVAKIPSELQQLNKRAVHRALEIMGARAAIRAGTEIQALAFTNEASRAYMQLSVATAKAVGAALSKRDAEFADYRERPPK